MTGRHLAKITLITLAAVALGACDQFGGKAVAVVDLDVVAKAIGHDEFLLAQINSANQQLSEQLTGVATQLQQALNDEKSRLEGEKVKDAAGQLEQLTQQANLRLNQTQKLAQQKSQQFRGAVIRQFYQQIKPTVEKVARRHNAYMVVTNTASVVWYEASADITDELIAELRSNPLPAPAPIVENGGSAAPAPTGASTDS